MFTTEKGRNFQSSDTFYFAVCVSEITRGLEGGFFGESGLFCGFGLLFCVALEFLCPCVPQHLGTKFV